MRRIAVRQRGGRPAGRPYKTLESPRLRVSACKNPSAPQRRSHMRSPLPHGEGKIVWRDRAMSPSPSAKRGDREGDTDRLRYLRDPDAIYRESFAIIRREARLAHLPPDIAEIAVRLIHDCGMTDIVEELAFMPEVAARGRAALTSG